MRIESRSITKIADCAVTNARFSSLHGLSVAPSPSRPRPFHSANRALVTSAHPQCAARAAGCHIDEAGEVRQVISTEAIKLAMAAVSTETHSLPPSEDAQATARRMAQQVLKSCAANRDAFARGAAGVSLLMVASIG